LQGCLSLSAVYCLPGDITDPLGRRIAKKINGNIVEKYLWKGKTTLLAVYDGNDNLLMRFMYADARAPLAMTKGGLNYYLCYDQVGSLRLVTDTFGNVVKEIDYDSFGNVLADSDPSFTVPFGFAGGLYDVDTGLVHFGARDYDPDTGMWTAKDPIFFKGGDTNLFGYAQNNPISLLDPSGLDVNIVINRTTYTNDSIIGTINVSSTVVSGTFSGYTLENANPPNPNLPLPQGTYSAASTNNIQGLIPGRILLDVPTNIATGIEIHNGNYPRDSQGCYLAGTSTSPDFVGNSVNAMAQINSIIAYDGSGRITVYITGGTTGP
jgi:RHS repeat-associated protein